MSVLDTRHHIVAVLMSWAEVVVEDLGVPAPDSSVTQLVRFLTHHLKWLTAQQPADDFADEVDGLRTELLRVIDPEHGGHRALAAPCVVPDCTGVIIASPQHFAGVQQGSIGCSFGHSWELRDWLALRQLMNRQREDVA
ncbi:hypothetical protein ACH41E_33590 [Streptomyces sp. NPDC020412]|uniref:hypothetical protein n=1 Tax=Streptomyces sp. NPDC020412 TaxID=3365073 RepID=UPI00379A158F